MLGAGAVLFLLVGVLKKTGSAVPAAGVDVTAPHPSSPTCSAPPCAVDHTDGRTDATAATGGGSAKRTCIYLCWSGFAWQNWFTPVLYFMGKLVTIKLVMISDFLELRPTLFKPLTQQFNQTYRAVAHKNQDF